MLTFDASMDAARSYLLPDWAAYSHSLLVYG